VSCRGRPERSHDVFGLGGGREAGLWRAHAQLPWHLLDEAQTADAAGSVQLGVEEQRALRRAGDGAGGGVGDGADGTRACALAVGGSRGSRLGLCCSPPAHGVYSCQRYDKLMW
jgi:hypothetical protein